MRNIPNSFGGPTSGRLSSMCGVYAPPLDSSFIARKKILRRCVARTYLQYDRRQRFIFGARVKPSRQDGEHRSEDGGRYLIHVPVALLTTNAVSPGIRKPLGFAVGTSTPQPAPYRPVYGPTSASPFLPARRFMAGLFASFRSYSCPPSLNLAVSIVPLRFCVQSVLQTGPRRHISGPDAAGTRHMPRR